MAIHLVNCHVLTCVDPEPTDLATVRIASGSITHLTIGTRTGPRSGPNDKTIDLEGGFLLPGLWDAHAHLALVLPPDVTKRPPHEAPAARAIRAGRNAIDALWSGITSVRVVGEADGVDIAWKQAFESGAWVGPRLFACGHALAATGGHATHAGLAVEADGPAEFRRLARLQFHQGADQLKLMVTGGIGSSATERADFVELSADEIEAAVEVAHGRGAIVGAHVGNSRAAKLCIDRGVDVIEHGYMLDDEAVDMMAKRGTYLVPTLYVTQAGVDEYRAAGWAEYAIENSVRIAPAHLDSFHRALQAGVKIASGEDTDSIARNTVREIEILAKCGMTPFETLVAATRTAAAMCGVEKIVGTVEVGKAADLIAVRTNPLEDLSQLRTPFLVIRGGRIIRWDGDAPWRVSGGVPRLAAHVHTGGGFDEAV